MTPDLSAVSSVFEALGVRPVINGAGPATRLGGMRLDPRIVAAMSDASQRCLRMEELHRRAGEAVADAVGTDGALVTCGAGAALVLGVAACMTGYDVAVMDRLPRRAGPKHEVVMLRSQRYPYDRLIEAVGAEIVEIGYFVWTHLHEVEAAINERTAAFLYYPSQPSPSPPLPDIVAVCHRHGVPVIVDAALEDIPPVMDTRWVSAGADLITFSGGKMLGGPQASGALCGRRDLIECAMLQMLDMDVRAPTWVERQLMTDGLVDGPPHHGLGRSMKVGKEEIAGFLEAIRVFGSTDHKARAERDAARLVEIAEDLKSYAGLAVTVPSAKDSFAPKLTIRIDPDTAGFGPWDLLRCLQERETPIHLNESLASEGVIMIDPRTMLDGEEDLVRVGVEESIALLNRLPVDGPEPAAVNLVPRPV
jgi:D-glucosaminate-6-phosphate ammonia-lyase